MTFEFSSISAFMLIAEVDTDLLVVDSFSFYEIYDQRLFIFNEALIERTSLHGLIS